MTRLMWLGLSPLVFFAPLDARAQRTHVADSSIAPALLVSALSLPSRTYELGDSAFSRRLLRVETQYSATSTTGVPTLFVLGVRSDGVSVDSTGSNGSVMGVRTGFARNDARDGVVLSAIEVYFGGRTLGHMDGRGPNIGGEIVAGWSGLVKKRGHLAFRFPIEFITGSGPVSASFSLVPAIAWGQLRLRSCEDRGSGDGCSPHGVQGATGPGRFVLGTGVTLGVGPGVSFTLGAQQLFAREQQPRFAIAFAVGG